MSQNGIAAYLRLDLLLFMYPAGQPVPDCPDLAVAVGRRFRGGFVGGAPTPEMVARGKQTAALILVLPSRLNRRELEEGSGVAICAINLRFKMLQLPALSLLARQGAGGGGSRSPTPGRGDRA
jgi:hypothetical protein